MTDLDWLARAVAEDAEPFDLAALEAAGIIERRGTWWALLDLPRLPQTALRAVYAFQALSKPPLVRFRRGYGDSRSDMRARCASGN